MEHFLFVGENVRVPSLTHLLAVYWDRVLWVQIMNIVF